MTATAADSRKQVLDTAVDIAVRLTLLGVLVVWCFRIFDPFLLPLAWGVIIAVAIAPVFAKLVALTGGRRGLTAVIFIVVALVLVLVPTVKITESAVRSIVELDRRMEEGTLTVPAPSESVRNWPVIGERVYAAWDQAHAGLSDALETYAPQAQAARAWVLAKAKGLAGGLIQTILALIIAGFMLTFAASGEERLRSVAGRVGGDRGEGLVGMTAATIRSVAQGVLGVALIQAAAAALGMFLADIPAWGLWTVLVLVLAVIQLPPLLVLGPIAVWFFTTADSTVVAVVFAVWSLVVSLIDSFLKPVFLGRGVDVPMPVILFGAIGGMVLHGIIGLFIGAVVLGIGYQLSRAWMEEQASGGSAVPAE
jgi:predicted PurR-regulated permease PerM